MDGGAFTERILSDPRSVEPPRCVGTLKEAPKGCYGKKGAGTYTVWCKGCEKWTTEASWEAHSKAKGKPEQP
jgi:hypothetical protein